MFKLSLIAVSGLTMALLIGSPAGAGTTTGGSGQAGARSAPASSPAASSAATSSGSSTSHAVLTPGAPARATVGTTPIPPRGARLLGAAPRTAQLGLDVVLAPRDPAGLAAAVAAVSTPGSSDYRHYLSNAAINDQFGPTPHTIAAVRQALVGAGLSPGRTSADGLAIPVSVTISQADQAFGVAMNAYQLSNGSVVYADAAAPQLASDIAGSVQGIVGLDGFEQMQPGLAGQDLHALAPVAATPTTSPGVIPGQPTACAAAANNNGWTAGNIAQAYNFDPLYQAGSFGQNESIDVYELSPYEASDIATYQTCYGTSVPVSQVAVDGGLSSSSRPAGNGPLEVALDAEDVVGLAPQLTAVHIYDTQNCGGCSNQYDEWNQIYMNNDAQVVSTSWYGCEIGQTSFDDAVDTLFQMMAAHGQTVVGLTGDVGAADCSTSAMPPVPFEAVSFPSSSPNLTAVGGTNLNALGNPTAVPPTETAWVNGGGGISTVFNMASYQNSVIDSTSTGTPCGNTSGDCRETPDVSADAGQSYAMYVGGWEGVIGTSASTPTWGALAALINSSAPSCNVGFMDPTLYSLGHDQYASSSGDFFNDVTQGNNDVNGVGYSAGTGFDLVTGLGTPVGANLAQGFCPRTSTTTSVATSGTPSGSGQAVTFTATVSPTDGGGSVAFYADGSLTALTGCGQVSLDPSHQAGCTTSTLSIGNHTIKAVYTGDVTGYLGSSGSVNQLVAGPPQVTKSFGAPTIALGTSTSLSFTITNPLANGTFVLDGVAFTDNLPSGLVVATPNGLSGSCGGGTITATAGGTTVSLAGATLAASSSCTFSVNVTGMAAGVENNSVTVGSSNAGTGNTATATVTVVAPPTIAKSFGGSTVPFGWSTSLTFDLGNPNATIALTGVGFTDTLPPGLIVATPNAVSESCGGGTVTATAGSGSISLSGATIPAATTCTLSINVTATSIGVKNNTTSAITSANGGTGLTASASITVVRAPTTTTVVAVPTSASFGSPVTFTATVVPSGPNGSGTNPTGTVSFFLNGSATPITVVPLSAAGTASFTTAALGAGSNAVVATYSGDTNFLPSTSSTPATVTVTCTTTITGNHAGLVLGPGSTCIVNAQITGAITVPKGGLLDLEDSTVTGAVSATNAAQAIRMCASSAASVTVNNATGFVVIGDATDGCPVNTIRGSLTLIDDTGGVQVIGNSVAGTVTASGNSGAGPFPGDIAPDISGNGH